MADYKALCLYFKFNGFITVSKNGKHHKVLLTITANPSGAETISVYLNSVLFTGVVATSGILAFSAHQVEEMNAWTGWSFQHIGSTIIFSGSSVGARSGTYSISSTGTLTGTFTTIGVGAALSTTTTTISKFNGDPVAIRRFNPYNWNSYQIQYYYGTSNIDFYFLNEITGIYQLVHTQRYSNIDGGSTSLSQPDLYLQRLVASVGSTTALTIQVASCSASLLGSISTLYLPKYSIQTTETIAGGVEEVVLAIQHRLVLNDVVCLNEILFENMSISVDGTKTVLIRIIKNPTTLGANISTNYDNYGYVDSTYSQVVYDTTSQTYTGGTIIDQFYLDKVSTTLIDLSKFGLILTRSDTILITSYSVNSSDISLSVALTEDI